MKLEVKKSESVQLADKRSRSTSTTMRSEL